MMYDQLDDDGSSPLTEMASSPIVPHVDYSGARGRSPNGLVIVPLAPPKLHAIFSHCQCARCVKENAAAAVIWSFQSAFSNAPHAHVKKPRRREFRCLYCSKVFHQNSNLVTHIRTHTGEKPFQCATCPRTFSQKSNLKRHERIHTGLKLFHCSICGAGSSRKSTLQSHLKTVHNLPDSEIVFRSLRRRVDRSTSEPPRLAAA